MRPFRSFLELTARQRAELVEYVRTNYQEEPDPELPEASEKWRKKMCLALVEPTPKMAFQPLLHTYERYIAELPEDERHALQVRVGEFILWRDGILRFMRGAGR